jgi:hypothetical protein
MRWVEVDLPGQLPMEAGPMLRLVWLHFPLLLSTFASYRELAQVEREDGGSILDLLYFESTEC